jgi:hypothetical protein
MSDPSHLVPTLLNSVVKDACRNQAWRHDEISNDFAAPRQIASLLVREK